VALLQQIETRSGRAASPYRSTVLRDKGGLEEEETNIEFVKCGEANDDVRISTLCPNMAKKDGEGDEDINEENISRRRAQSTNEEDPGIGLDSGGH
jgi:hypothetical protein